MARAPHPPVLEVIGTGIGHVVIQREAADLIAPLGSPILPALVTLISAHRATGLTQSEHRCGDAIVRVVQATTALVVGVANTGDGGAASPTAGTSRARSGHSARCSSATCIPP